MWKSTKGFVLAGVLFVLVTMSLLAVAGMQLATDGLRASQNTLAMQRALNSTEAGIVQEMSLGMPCGKSGTSLQTSWITLTDLGADYAYRTTIQRIDLPFAWMPPGQAIGRNCILPPTVPGGVDRPDRLYLLQVEGRWRDARRSVRYVVQADSLHQSFRVVSRGESQ